MTRKPELLRRLKPEDVNPDDARRWWEEGDVLIFHGIEWPQDFGVLQSGMEPVEYEREPGGPWQTGKTSPEVRRELVSIYRTLYDIFAHLYGDLGPPGNSQFTYRPTITRGEMHQDNGADSYRGQRRDIITGFVNVDTEPRRWKLLNLPGEIEWKTGDLWIFRAEKVPHQVVWGRCCVQYNWILF